MAGHLGGIPSIKAYACFLLARSPVQGAPLYTGLSGMCLERDSFPSTPGVSATKEGVRELRGVCRPRRDGDGEHSRSLLPR